MADDNAKDLDAKAKEVASGLSDLSKILKQKANAFSRLSGTTEGVDDLFTQLGDKLKVELETRQGAANNLRDQRILNSRLNERLGQYSGTLLGVIATSSAKIKEAKAHKELAKKEQELTGAAIEKLKEKIKSDELEIGQRQRLKDVIDRRITAQEQLVSENVDKVIETQAAHEHTLSEIAKLEELLQGDNTVDQQMYLERSLAAEQAKLAETEKYIVQLDESRTELAKLKEKQKNVGEKIDSASEKQEENSKQLEILTKRYEDEADIIRTKGAAVFNAYLAALTNTAAEINKLVDPVRKLQQQFGITAGAAASLRFGALDQSIRSFANFLSGAPVSFKEIEAAVSDLRAEFGGIVSTREAREFAVAAKEMGVTTQQLAAARRVFMTQTMGDLAGAQSQQERFIKVFTQQGMTSRDAMEFIGSNSELLARSGARFQQSMAKAAGEAKKIGVDLSKVNQVGDNIIGNFEGFLESMAELGAMGFGFDATRLAEVAERGDTGALFDELRSQLRMTGRDLTDLTRSQQLALSSAFGMGIEDFQRMAGATPDIGEAEKTNEFLKKSVDFLERIAGLMTGISTVVGIVNTVLSGIHTKLLKTIAFNTSVGGVGRTTFGRAGGRARGARLATRARAMGRRRGLLGRGGRLSPVARGAVRGVGIGAVATVGGSLISRAGESLKEGGREKTGSALSTTGTAVQYAGMGAMIGSVIPGVGTAIGAALGGALGLVVGITKNIEGWKQIVESVTSTIKNIFSAIIGAIKSIANLIAAPFKSILGFSQRVRAGQDERAKLRSQPRTRTQGGYGPPVAQSIASSAGHGDRTLVTPDKTVSLNNDDTVVAMAPDSVVDGNDVISTNAGTELLSKGIIAKSAGDSEPNINVNVDLEKLERKLDQVISAMASMQVVMDGNKVGRVMSDNEQKANAMGIFQTQRLTG